MAQEQNRFEKMLGELTAERDLKQEEFLRLEEEVMVLNRIIGGLQTALTPKERRYKQKRKKKLSPEHRAALAAGRQRAVEARRKNAEED